MKTLRRHTLIYDRDCPMCRIYTGAFVRNAWLDEHGRTPYSEVTAGDFCGLDMVRAKDEIALVNRQTGEVKYGIDSLIHIVTFRAPCLRPLLGLRLIKNSLRLLYAFISYNRKVIAAVKPTGKPCTPRFSLPYRIAYLLFAFMIVSVALTGYAATMEGVLPGCGPLREYLVCGGQVVFQALVLLCYRKEKLMDYLGNMMTVSLMGALALVPMLLAGRWLHGHPVIFTGYFLMAAFGMLLEHLRRMNLLGLGWLPSVMWVVYRLLVAAVIFW